MHLGPEVIHERLPGIAETARIFAGVDVTKDPIPVLPTCHYNMGGIPGNYKGEVVTVGDGNPNEVVPGLMAIGEAASVSVHGANRLGSNSLLDLVVFGRAAANHCAEIVKPGAPHREIADGVTDRVMDRFDRLRHASGSTPTAKMRAEMQRTMQNHAAVFRTGDVMREGLDELNKLYAAREDIHVSDRSLIWNSDLVETLEFENLIGQALVTMAGGLAREESRGAHAREDFAERDDENWMKHTCAWITDTGEVKLDYRPVAMQPLTNEVQSFPPKARVY
jgi:succinate dehydrogenase / fumarate reductase flavoprotein subunit